LCSECEGTDRFLVVSKEELYMGQCLSISDDKEYCLDSIINRVYESICYV